MKRKEEKSPLPPSEDKRRAAQSEGEARRREYLDTLDPRQAEDLAMGDPVQPVYKLYSKIA